MPPPELPPPPNIAPNDPQAEVKTLHYQTQLALIKASYEDDLQREKAEAERNFEREKQLRQNDYTQAQAVNAAYLDVAKASFERAAARANFVQGAATAVSGAYLGVLALSFVASGGTRLPASGIAPTVFLGTAIFLATMYNSFITKPGALREHLDDGTFHDRQVKRRNTFIEWNTRPLLRKKNFLQAAIVCLGTGTVMLPLPYLQIDESAKWIFVVVGLLYIPVMTRILSTQLEEAELEEQASQRKVPLPLGTPDDG